MSHATRRQLQSLIGSLIYVHKCVKPARLFVNRLLEVLRLAPPTQSFSLPKFVFRDIAWFNTFLSQFNGSVKFKNISGTPKIEIFLDSSLKSLGGVWGHLVYTVQIASLALPPSCTIVHYEMFNVLLALRLWDAALSGSRPIIYCDNWAVVCTLQSGRAVDPILLSIARNIWLVCAIKDIEIIVIHILGKSNIVADLLSRWTGSQADGVRLQALVLDPQWCSVLPEHVYINQLI